MAEAFVNARGGSRLKAYSAGLERGTLNAIVVRVMNELGIDISGNRTKRIDDHDIASRDYDYVVTVCDEAGAERCPIYPTRGKRLHWSFPDPSAFTGSDEDRLQKTRDIRDAIRERIDEWLNDNAELRATPS
jgi:arsenate reductase